jgi:hypothetical protein
MDEKYKIEQREKNVGVKKRSFPKFFVTLFIEPYRLEQTKRLGR